MANRYSLKSIQTLPAKPVFFDANILLYIFWPTGYYPSWIKSYQKAFNEILKSKREMTVNFIVISEIINRAIRIEYDKYLNKNRIPKEQLAYKKYRDSSDGENVLQDIYNIVKNKILSNFNVIDKTFTKSDIVSFLNVTPLDFSDKAIGSICENSDCILLTNDSDYSCLDIDILSSNPKILKS